MSFAAPKPRFTADRWTSALTWVLDFTALSALAATFELPAALFMGIGAAFLISRIKKIRLSQFLLVASLVIVVVGALIAWRRLSIPSILAASFAAPIAHAILWFAREKIYRAWRLGVGFMELVLAGTLTAEVYLSFFIIIFVLFACVTISCSFLAHSLTVRAPELTEKPLPRGFVRMTFAMTTLIFVAAALIFPILPRVNNDESQYNQTHVGYNEEINLADWTKFSGADGGNAVLWLYSDRDTDLTKEFYLGLIRGRALELFDGHIWSPAPRNIPRPPPATAPYLAVKHGNAEMSQIEAVRGPLATNVLPSPYGTTRVDLSDSDESIPAELLPNGEWHDRLSREKKVKFVIRYRPYDVRLFDAPITMHSYIPARLKTDRLIKLANTLFAGTKSEREKVDRVINYFKKEKFKASLESVDPGIQSQSEKLNLHPIEQFLFITKQGHCELFASSMALLLRFAGVPTRMLAGFRINKPMVSGVLTIRSSDAHAWIEAWSDTRGWLPIDPTPRVVRPQEIMEQLRDGYEVLSGLWFRYILGFSERGRVSNSRTTTINKKQNNIPQTPLWITIVCALGGFGAIGLLLWWRLKYNTRRQLRPGLRQLLNERARMEKLLCHALEDRQARWEQVREKIRRRFGEEISTEFEQWTNDYHAARFGKSEQNNHDIVPHLERRRKKIQEKLDVDKFKSTL